MSAGRSRWRAIPCAILGLLSLNAASQLPPAVDQSRQRPPTSPMPNSRLPDFTLQSPERSSVPRAIDKIRFEVRGIRIEGAELYPAAVWEAEVKALVGKRVLLEDLRQLAEKIESRYRQAGYFLSRAFLPPQRVQGGVFKIEVVEGRIGQVVVESGSDSLKARVREMLEPLRLQRPLELKLLERHLLLVNDLPGLRATSVLRPSQELGATDLYVQLEELSPRKLTRLGNEASSQIGPWVSSWSWVNNHVLIGGDELQLASSSTVGDKELRSANVRYSFPVGHQGSQWTWAAVVSRARPGGSLVDFELQSASSSLSGRLRLPVLRQRRNSVFLEGAVIRQRSTLKSMGEDLSASDAWLSELSLHWRNEWPGVMRTQFSLTQSTVERWHDQNAASNPMIRHKQRTLSSLNLVSEKTELGTLELGANVQWAGRTLYSSEKMAIGGAQSVRGFSPATYSGDMGKSLSLEWTLPSLSSESAPGWARQLNLYAFADAAQVRDLNSSGQLMRDDRLASVGIGVRGPLIYGIQGQLYWAVPRKVNNDALPGPGLYLNMVWQW